MRRLFSFPFILFTSLFFLTDAHGEERDLVESLPEQVAAFNSHHDTLIGGVICPLTGQPLLKITDLIAPGAKPIIIDRSYVSPQILNIYSEDNGENNYVQNSYLFKTYQGWEILPHRYIQCKLVKGDLHIRLPLSNGAVLDYKLTPEGDSELISQCYGIHNWGPSGPSASYDLRNIKIRRGGNYGEIIVNLPDGTKRFYSGPFISSFDFIKYNLVKEVLLSGHVHNYSDRFIKSYDPQEQHCYATIQLSHWYGNKFSSCKSHTGQEVVYSYEMRHLKGKFQVNKSKTEYDFLLPTLMTMVTSPYASGELQKHNKKCLLESFEGDSLAFSCDYDHKSEHCKIRKLLRPVGEDGLMVPVYTFSYLSPEAGKKGGATRVDHCDGSYRIFHYSKELLLEQIEHFEQTGLLRKKELFQWDENQWLKSRELYFGDGRLLYGQSYVYDAVGNPIKETVTGNFSGNSELQSRTIFRSYSDDDFHLLLKEEYEEGPTYLYEYLKGTNLLTKHMTVDHGKVILCTSYEYDQHHNLIKEVSENGSVRTVTRYVLRQEAPFLHLPEWKEEYYESSGAEHLLRKVRFTYDNQGRVSQEEIYDANGNFSHCIKCKYDERGNLLRETNAIGQSKESIYDEKGRCIFSLPFSRRTRSENIYDKQNRLEEKRVFGDDQSLHYDRYHYDALDRLIEKTDHFGHSINYKYDPNTNQPTQVSFQEYISSLSEPITVVKRKGYDPFGRMISSADANGHKTLYSYNSFDNLTKVVYPDGLTEIYSYDLNGNVLFHLDQERNEKCYTYDILGNVLTKKIIDCHGNLVATEEFCYDGDRLISHTDKEGFKTNHLYDGAGRLQNKKREGHDISYEYDVLGRQSHVIYHNGKNSQIEHTQYDLLERMIRKTIQGPNRNILKEVAYTYDDAGHIESITRNIDGEVSCRFSRYDPFGRIIERCDGKGVKTTWEYDESGNTLKSSSIKPNGLTTLTVYDTQKREIERTCLNADETVARQYKIYDPQGNLVEQHDQSWANGHKRYAHVLRSEYDSLNRLTSSIRGADTDTSRRTTYSYTPSGRIASKTLPSGAKLKYTYDPLGFLQSVKSLDGSICQTFEFNRLGHLLSANDGGASFKRICDPFGNTMQEIFSTGIQIDKTYDALNQPLTFSLDGHGSIHYEYDSCFLSCIKREHPKKSYSYSYLNYDSSGNSLEELLPEGLGKVCYRYDENQRLTEISSPYFQEIYSYDEQGQLTSKNDEPYSYDSLSQLAAEGNHHAYHFDSLYNDLDAKHNVLSELVQLNDVDCEYDLNGNRIKKGAVSYQYDLLGRLKQASDIEYTYDALGRCLERRVGGKEKECYIYDGWQEIGAISSKGELKNLRLLGDKGKTVAIELGGKPYAALSDLQGSIRSLVDLSQKSPLIEYCYTAFGESLKTPANDYDNPWKYNAKRWDPSLKLYQFAKRYYDPELRCWLTPDPAGFVDGINLYQFNFNNPFLYTDPTGEFVFAIPLLVWGAEAVLTLTLGEVLIATAVVATTAYVYQHPEFVPQVVNTILTLPTQINTKRHTPDQEALNGLVDDATHGGRGQFPLSSEDAETIDDWANEVDYPGYRADEADLATDDNHWVGGPHTHMPGVGDGHIPVEPGTTL